ncbi:MAG TPA: lipase [Saprospiraceae bacterium]|nr:lipase [Saprospiraceae bacterium]HMQ81314.1 lipase [Saprospiraceae bacterium]
MFKHQFPLAILIVLWFSACEKEPFLENVPVTEAGEMDESGISTLQGFIYPEDALTPRSLADITLTTHFQSWLSANGYGAYQFSNPAIDGDSFGGKANNNTPVTKQPVLFFHGNGDKAVGYLGTTQSGWTGSLNYFLGQGYTEAELYAITWGDANPLLSAYQTHSKPYVMRIRAFIEAVLAYTGSSKVDIVCHSMGVTLCRKAIEGGWAYDPDNGGAYYLGASLTNKVDAFIGIAGGNKGLTNCYFSPGNLTETCNDETGFYPGYLWFGQVYGVSDFIADVNSSSGYEGSYRYSIWSPNDQIVGYGCIVYGQNTCYLPGQTGHKSYSAYGHFGLKDNTGYCQYQMATAHQIP